MEDGVTGVVGGLGTFDRLSPWASGEGWGVWVMKGGSEVWVGAELSCCSCIGELTRIGKQCRYEQ
jgi:hypothetical protein